MQLLGDETIQTYTYKQLGNIYTYVSEIIDSLPDKALDELTSGYEGDLNQLIEEITRQTNLVINHNASRINSESLGHLTQLEHAFDQQLKKFSLNYFKTTVLTNFQMGWRNLEWGNMIQLYPWSAYLAQRGSGKSFEFCYAAPLWRLYTYDPPKFCYQNNRDNMNRKWTIMVTNESRLVNIHISKITEEINDNDILREKLNRSGKPLGKETVITDTGSRLDARSFGSQIRGTHPGSFFVDDFISRSALYSKEQREKFHEVFYAEILPALEPEGLLIVSGTPFHIDDLYGDLKRDKRFKVFEYPGIFPDGKLLAPDRFTFNGLMGMKKSLGSIVFSREILVSPVSDASSIFPWSFLEKSFIGQESIGYVNNIESYPIKMKKVVIGCDFAISGNIAADYSVFTVWGLSLDDKFHLMHIWRAKGVSHNEQVSKIIELDHAFKPNRIICENNGFQRVLIDLVRQRGLKNIEEFTTTSKIKKDDYSGLPSISAMFERGDIRVPAKNGDDKEKSINFLNEWNSVTYNEDKGTLEASGNHDDQVMSSFFAIFHIRENKVNANLYFV